MKIIISTLILLLNLSCRLPSLGIKQNPIKPGILKTHGLYYNKPDYWHFALYENGVINMDAGVIEKNIEYVIKIFQDTTYRVPNQKTPYFWGLYEVRGDSIYIAHWESREWAAYGVTKYEGIVLNDTTLLLNHPVVGLDTFYFHYLTFKPDSLNKFFK